jgi:hypothetical protein
MASAITTRGADPTSTTTPGSSATPTVRTARPWGRIPRPRLAMLLLGGLGLVLGTYTGLARGGSGHSLVAADLHGIVMVLGFLGTVITLERAIALAARWGYVAPLASGLAVLVLPLARPVGSALLLLAGIVLLATYAALLRRRHLDEHLLVMTVGGCAWVAAVVLWVLGYGPVRITPLLTVFLVLTVVGERLELSRLTLPAPARRRRFLVAVALFVLGASLAPWMRATGLVLGGLGLLGQVTWLLRYDLARRTIRRPGLPRFAATCMLTAYGWLGVSGLFWIAIGLGARGPLLHDAMVHALFLGFVLSMVMGHAPIIIPAVLRTSYRYDRWVYPPLLLLHVSVALRIGADLAGSFPLREVALHGNIAALLWFVVVTIRAVRGGRGDTLAGLTPPAPLTSQSPTPAGLGTDHRTR